MSSTLLPSGTSGWNTKEAEPWSSSAIGETYARPEMDIPRTRRPWPGWRRTMEAASVGSTRASLWTNCLSGHVSSGQVVQGEHRFGGGARQEEDGGGGGQHRHGGGHGGSTRVGNDVGGGLGGF